MQYNIIVADDHPIFFEGIEQVLQRNTTIANIAHANNGQELMQMLESDSNIHVIFMDISMPNMNGIDATRKIKELYPEIKIIGISQYEDSGHIKAMFKAGANAYVLKNVRSAEINEAIKCVLNNEEYFFKDVSEELLKELKVSFKSNSNNEFSFREEQIITCICKGWHSDEIAAELNISTKTIEYYRTQIFKKTGCKNIASLVNYAWENGLMK